MRYFGLLIFQEPKETQQEENHMYLRVLARNKG